MKKQWRDEERKAFLFCLESEVNLCGLVVFKYVRR